MAGDDSIVQQMRDAATRVLVILGNQYPALAYYRLRRLEESKLRHTVIAVIVLVLGVISHWLPGSFHWTDWIVAFVVLAELALLWLDYLELAKPRNEHLRIVNVFPALLERLKNAAPPTGYQLESFGNGSVIRSDDLDAWIREKPTIGIMIPNKPVEQRILKYNEPYLLESFDYLITRLHRSEKRFFNERKVSLQTELNPDELKKPNRAVLMGKTSYIASCLTNDACVNQSIRTADQAESVYADLTEMYPIENRGGGDCILSLD
jgi:hypothetical protein